jgi:hypothetical protein
LITGKDYNLTIKENNTKTGVVNEEWEFKNLRFWIGEVFPPGILRPLS